MQLKIKQTLQTAALLVLSLLVTTTAFSQTAGVIGVKFGFTGGYSSTINLGPTDQAGVVAVTNWNNLLANVLAPQGNPERAAAINVTWNIPQDSAGNALSGVTLTPDGFNDGWNSGGTACANGRLLFNCWKFNAGNGLIDGGGRSYAEFTIANLPGSAYDLHVYINDNNGNYWGNIQANSVIAIGSDIDSDGFNGASSDPCSLGTPLHTAAGFGNAANYVKLPAVATTSGGVITVTVVMLGGGDFGVSGVELVPAADLVLKRDTLPNYAETVVGDQVVFSAAFSNSPAVNLQWQDVNGGVTNYINTGVVNVTNNGVVTSTLTLNNVQLTNSGSYRLKAINTTNSSDIAYSSDAPLVVGNSPAPVNNIIVNYSGQTGGNFYPAWTINTNIDLIYGFVNGSPQTPGQFVPGAGNYGLGQTYGDPTILSDGGLGDIKSALVSCGPGDSAGQSMTYTLDTSSATSGFDLTNITVYGGWTDGGRDEQKYQVLYSTVVDPANFVPLSLVDYNPTDPSGASCATRTTLIPATGALAYNVYAVQFNFNTAVWPKNGWEGYSEISINGTPSTGIRPTLTLDIRPLTAEDVVGSTLNLTASFTGAVGVQWQKNGTNIPGATSQTLILNNLQLTDTATNGGYRLVASNAAGTTTTRGCAVIVDPAPAAAKNVVTAYAFQSSDQRSFSPTWDTSALTSSLIYGTTPSDSGIGDFTGAFDAVIAGGPSVLTDGTFGTNDFADSANDLYVAVIGSDTRAGNFVTYTLTGSTNGYNITNIVTTGGWNDGGRDQQAYTVYYANVAHPTTFLPLASVNCNPVNPSGISIDRATIKPVTGSLAANVVALKFDYTSPAGENGYSGYSEIGVFGAPSAPYAAPTPPILSASAVSGGNLVVTGTGGTPNRAYAWLTSTDLTIPVANWTVSSTGVLDSTGALSNAIPISTSTPASFFRLWMP